MESWVIGREISCENMSHGELKRSSTLELFFLHEGVSLNGGTPKTPQNEHF